MRITPQNVVNHELVGLPVTLVQSSNKDAEGLSGRIIDESRNVFKLECRGQEKTVAKHCNTFEFTLPGGDKARVVGDLVLGRPEDRVAKSIRKSHNW
jgi:ribonuclease P protein subunit POP4